MTCNHATVGLCLSAVRDRFARLRGGSGRPYRRNMFTIEHEFDSTLITVVDDGEAPLQEDLVINAFEECVTVEQYDERQDSVQKITISMSQLRDLAAAMDLPEGSYSLVLPKQD